MPRRFRLLYVVVITCGLLWIAAGRPLWLDPTQALDDPRQIEAIQAETIWRVKVTAIVSMAVIVLGELLAVLRRLVLGPY